MIILKAILEPLLKDVLSDLFDSSIPVIPSNVINGLDNVVSGVNNVVTS